MRKTVEILPKKNIVLYHEDDVSEVLENNKKLRAMEQTGEFRHVACIPTILLLKWMDEERNRGRDIQFLSKELDEIVAQKLRDPDWAYLRTDGPKHRNLRRNDSMHGCHPGRGRTNCAGRRP